MKLIMLDKNDMILAAESIEEQDYEVFTGIGAITMTIDVPGIPHRLLLMEDSGRTVAEGKFKKDISLSKEWHEAGDQITIRLNI